MKSVGSRLGFDLNHIPGRLVFRVIIVALSRERSDRIDSRVHHRDAEHRVIVVHAVELIIGSGKFLAAGVNERRLLRVFARSVLERVDDRTRCKQSKIGEIPIRNWKRRNLCAAQLGLHDCAIGFDRGRRGAYRNFLRLRAYLHRSIHTDRLRHVYADVLLDKFLKTGLGDCDRVAARRQIGSRIVTRVICCSFRRNTGSDVCKYDLRSGDGSTAGIGDSADDIPRDRLTKNVARAKHHET